MGQKISPILFRSKQRLANTEPDKTIDPTSLQKSVWFATGRAYTSLLLQDIAIRRYLHEQLKQAGLVECVIRRFVRRTEITLYVTKPGLVIGKAGASVNKLKDDLIAKFKLQGEVKLNIEEYKDPYRSALVIAREIAVAIEKRVPYRKLVKTFIEKIKYSRVLGAKISLSGRLNGVDIARTESFSFGSIPRHTIDADIDFAQVTANLKSAGIIGITVLLYKGSKYTNYQNQK
jgi:small subunit ribosomal protein S3